MEEKENIRHSDIFLGETFDEECGDSIRHWKYIRKEKKNGYTRYYYKDDEYDKAEEDYSNALTDQYRKQLGFGVASQDRQQYENEARSDGRVSQEENKQISKYSKAESEAFDSYMKASNKAKAAQKKYTKTAIKTLPRRTIGRGLAAVSTALSMLGNKIKKKLKD